jgi:hypothetical protein
VRPCQVNIRVYRYGNCFRGVIPNHRSLRRNSRGRAVTRNGHSTTEKSLHFNLRCVVVFTPRSCCLFSKWTNSNFDNLCNAYPANDCFPAPGSHGAVDVVSTNNGSSGAYVNDLDCSVPNAICIKSITYSSVVGLAQIVGFQYTVNPVPCMGDLCGLGALVLPIVYAIVGFLDIILIVIPLWFVIRKTRNPPSNSLVTPQKT